jgi:hypothetical protein
MKYLIVLIACMAAIVAAAPSKGHHSKESNSNESNSSSEFAQLTSAQRTCIANAVRADTSIITALKNCHTTHGGLACVKAIPALASCFA